MKSPFITILLVFLFSFLNVSSQDYAIKGALLDGREIISYDILSENDSCVFKLINTGGKIINHKDWKWTLEILTNNSEYVELITKFGDDEFEFKLDTISLPKLFASSYEAKQISSNELSLLQARIICKNSNYDIEEVNLEVPVYLNLLPAIPQFSYWTKPSDESVWNRLFFKISCNRYSGLQMCVKTHAGRQSVTIYYDCNPDEDSNYELIQNLYGDSISVSFLADNFYGFSHSKTEIIKRDILLSISEQNERVDFTLYPNPVRDYLIINGDIENIQQLIISDNTGRVTYATKRLDNNQLDFTSYLSGIYFISIKHRNSNKVFIAKIIKQ